MKLTTLREFYNENGYVIVDLFEPAIIEELLQSIYCLVGMALGETISSYERLSSLLLKLQDEDKVRYGNIVRKFYHLTSLASASSSRNVIDTLKSIGLELPVYSTHPEVRTDNPYDDRYMQPLHQDWRYGQGSYDSVTVWTPFCDANLHNGSISVYPGTHKLGYIETEELTEPRRFKLSLDEQNLLDMGYKELVVDVDKYKSVIFSQLLVHKSNVNTSDKVRLSFQCRYSNLQEMNYKKNNYSIAFGSEYVWDKTPSSEDMKEIYG